MTHDEIYSRLTPIFHEVFDNDNIALTPELSANDVDEWDSLSHIRLIVAVEEGFGIRFNSAEIVKLENVGQFVDLIGSKAGA